mgnify:CR=1 FL=1
MATRKPYFKLTVGKAPYTSADLRFPCGRFRIEVSDAHPECSKLLHSFCDIHWNVVCSRVLKFWEDQPPTPVEEYLAGGGVMLTEPPNWTLRQEVERLYPATVTTNTVN